MEPVDQQRTQAWSAPPGMPWGSGGPPPAAGAGAAAPPGQARTGLIVLAAVLTELVLIAALANQWMSDRIAQNIGDAKLGHLVEQSWLTYQWRFSPRSGFTHAWGGELGLIGVTLVLTGLLVFALVRGAITFWRAFFATWLAVLGATVVGAFVRGLVDTDTVKAIGGTHAGRVTQAIFGPVGPHQAVVVAGFLLGLVTGLVAGAVAVGTRHRPRPAAAQPGPAYRPPEAPPPFFGDPAAAPPWQERFEPRAGPPPADAQQTTRLAPPGEQPQLGAPGEHPTTQFPRPPDDEQFH
jgi:hypothetical protein